MKLLTRQDLMERWQINETTIYNYMKNGIITKIEGLGCVRFHPRQIESIENEALEGKINSRKTWREIQLEEENSSLKAEIDRLNNIIGQVIGNLSNVWRG